jgi:hypothetical protein
MDATKMLLAHGDPPCHRVRQGLATLVGPLCNSTKAAPRNRP